MALQTRKLTETIGTEVIAPVEELLKPEVAAQVRQILVERGVLLFPQLGISDEDQVRLASLIGTVREEGEKGIFKITLDNKANAQALYLKGSFNWHMDGTHDHVPVFGSLLTARVLSKEGGDTLFANSYAAYEALPQAMKDRIADLRVVHSFAYSMEQAGIEKTPETEAHWNSIPDQTHALVWPHKSGRKSLVIGCHASHVVGMDPDESAALIAELMDWVTQERFTYRHKWTVGDMLIWDNTGVLHRATPYALGSGRMMHRTTLMGEEAFA
ncbi:TauD/TfdA family dioxygenase [Novosphingobium sp. TH158]|uniref:TauD/TfdA dioxygenase family protein n=1 Tax=Novosphingobium sp. TH158 TaxID=2067455 RepID=UPI000C7E7DA9|nr:TauD/TfdA family dioxygenase [Novosphingobium sp. TH158]PLK26772.1 taurine catabolism dioxygenase [Novosphingobium sp. TH158]